MVVRWFGALLLLFALPALAQEPPASAAMSAAPEAANMVPAGTALVLRLEAPVSSKTAITREIIAFTVVRTVSSLGQDVVPAGTAVQGEVVHVAKARWGGKPGELVLAARRLQLPSGPVRLRSSLGVVGANTTNEAMALGIFTLGLGSFISGGEIELPAGTLFAARTAEPIVVPTSVIPSPAPAPAVPAP